MARVRALSGQSVEMWEFSGAPVPALLRELAGMLAAPEYAAAFVDVRTEYGEDWEGPVAEGWRLVVYVVT